MLNKKTNTSFLQKRKHRLRTCFNRVISSYSSSSTLPPNHMLTYSGNLGPYHDGPRLQKTHQVWSTWIFWNSCNPEKKTYDDHNYKDENFSIPLSEVHSSWIMDREFILLVRFSTLLKYLVVYFQLLRQIQNVGIEIVETKTATMLLKIIRYQGFVTFSYKRNMNFPPNKFVFTFFPNHQKALVDFVKITCYIFTYF